MERRRHCRKFLLLAKIQIESFPAEQQETRKHHSLTSVIRMSISLLKPFVSDRSSNLAKMQLTPCIGFKPICALGVIYPLL